MRRNPVYVFSDRTSQGIFDIPLESMIQIIDSDGMGTPLFTQIVDKTGMNSTSTIADFLANPIHYVALDKDTLSELEKVGDGWRLLGKDAAYYGALGVSAVDLSTSQVVGEFGASGVNSVAMGSGTKAVNPNSVAMGAWNVGLSGETIVEVGSGITSAPKNVFEVYANGTVTAPEATDASIDARGPQTLTTSAYVQNRVAAEFPASTTDDLAEGANLYYTDARDTANFGTNIALASVGDLVDVDLSTAPVIGEILKFDGTNFVPDIDLHEVTSVNGFLGDVVLKTDDVAEGANRYYTESYFNASLTTKTTSDVAEGTNQYYTVARTEGIANARIQASKLSALNDVGLTDSPALGSVLAFNGTNWQPATDTAGVTDVNGLVGPSVVLTLDGISNVSATAPTTGETIKFDGTNWVNSPDLDTVYSVVTNTVDGLMSFGDFNKLAGVEANAQVNIAPTKADIDALGVNAATVNGLNVETAVPVGASFVAYDDTTIQAEVDLNTAKVSYTDAALVATHTTDIGTNTTDIGTNTTSIATNTTDIGTNTTAIATNATNIGANTTDIGTNTTAIATNATDIATNASGIATNVTDIGNNATDISTNATAIALNTSKVSFDTKVATDTHVADITTNPHAVTKAQVGLSNVDNTADADKPVSTATQTELNLKPAKGATGSFTNTPGTAFTITYTDGVITSIA